MKWFFCWSQKTEFRHDHGWPNLIRASVESALQHTTLEPHFIYDGAPSDLTAQLEAAGVTIHFHRLSFASVLEAYYGDQPQFCAVAEGAFLRFDIPLFTDDPFALYTDADVMFQPGFSIEGYCPSFLAAAPEFSRGSLRDLNSGVMVMNVPVWRQRHKELIEFTKENMNLGLDQEILRQFVGTEYLLLPDRFNWKPYWGQTPDAAIIHWHGPKPVTAATWLLDKTHSTHAAWLPLLERNPDAYAAYVLEHADALNAWQARITAVQNRKTADKAAPSSGQTERVCHVVGGVSIFGAASAFSG